MMGERIQKVLAHQGVASRRTLESWIEQGRIRVNGKRAVLGQKVTPSCKITVDNRPVVSKVISAEYLIYHKPVGEVCTRQPEPHQTSIYDSLPKPSQGRWLSVGRLDLNTSGLVILTNDGEKLQEMQHPKYNFDREYKVRAFGPLTDEVIKNLQSKLHLEDGPARFKKVRLESSSGLNHWFKVTLTEGRNRIVRRLFSACDLEVNRLIRIRFGQTCLPRNLRPGEYKSINLD